MAKLKARGRTELARVSKEKTNPALVPCDGCEGTGNRVSDLTHLYKVGDVCTACEGKGQKPPLTTWERRTLALMSDGKILEKLDVKFQPMSYESRVKPYSYGWKVKGSLKVGKTAEQWVAVYEKLHWTKERV